MGVVWFLSIVAIGVLSAASQYLLKVGLSASVGDATAATLPVLMLRVGTNPYLITAAFLYVVAFGIYGFLLVKSDVRKPIAFAIIIAVLLGYRLFASYAKRGPKAKPLSLTTPPQKKA